MARRLSMWMLLVAMVTAIAAAAPGAQAPDRARVLETMKRATTFMVEKVAHQGGYVWSYLPDLSRRWGEMEARPTMIWIQPPGTPSMGHLFLDAYRATGDEYYYRAAEQVASALSAAQHPSGGWNYIADFAGEQITARMVRHHRPQRLAARGISALLRQRHLRRCRHGGVGEVLPASVCREEGSRHKVPLDKAIAFVLDSQYPMGLWPQRFPRAPASGLHGLPDYTAHVTFNDDVAAENIDFLLMCYQALGDARLLDPIIRGMNAFISTQLGPPQPGWGLQHTLDLKPSGRPHLRT